MDPGERLGWASREDSGFVLVFCGRLEDAFRRRKLLKRRGKQKWKVIGRHGGKSMGWVTASLWTQWEIQNWLFLMPKWLGP